jgi:transcriptional regulator GlxA family with amidase domain
VVAASGLDRRALERRVSRLLGRGIAEEIRRQRVARAKELLRSGDLPLPKIARLTALGSPEHMNAVFRRMVGLSPLAYRRSMRAT